VFLVLSSVLLLSSRFSGAFCVEFILGGVGCCSLLLIVLSGVAVSDAIRVEFI